MADDDEQGHKISCRGHSLFSGLFRFFRFRKCGSPAKRSLMYSGRRVFQVLEPIYPISSVCMTPWCAAHEMNESPLCDNKPMLTRTVTRSLT